MKERIGEIIKIVYNRWKIKQPKAAAVHPDEETLVCFVKGKLGYEENKQVQVHLFGCDDCVEKIIMQIQLEPAEGLTPPADLLTQAKDLVKQDNIGPLEVIFKLKDNILELLNTTGDILVGQELMPLPALRNRHIKEFKNEVVIFKDVKNIRIELKLESRHANLFNLTVIVKDKLTQKIIKDSRITLLKDGLELESYQADSGQAIFENILLGKYNIEISEAENKLACITIDIKT